MPECSVNYVLMGNIFLEYCVNCVIIAASGAKMTHSTSHFLHLYLLTGIHLCEFTVIKHHKTLITI